MARYRVDFQGTIYGVEAFQHGHGVESADTALAVAQDAAAQWLAILTDVDFSGLFRTDITWSQVNVSELGASPSAPVITSATEPIADGGTLSSEGLPAQCSVVVSLRTATAGSRARGRMYLPPCAAAALSSAGRLDTAELTNLADAMGSYFGAMSAAGHTPTVFSGVGGVWTDYVITNIRVGNVIDTQRRRRADLAEVYQTRTF